MDKNSKILIVGGNDVIENALFEHFSRQGFSAVVSSSKISLNPTIQASVYDFFQTHRPEYVFLSSVRSGGIEANIKNSAEFIYQNLESQNNIVYASWKFGVKKLLFVAASCIYPKEANNPIKEDSLLTAELEKTSEAYSVAKIAGVKLCEHFHKQVGLNAISVVPATIYGPGSDTDLEKAHVMGALIAKFSKAVKENQKEVVVWGSGNPRREFLFSSDFAEACLFLMDRYNDPDLINVGCGEDVSIKELAEVIAQQTGFNGNVKFDSSKPNGAKQKLLDNSRISKLGWKPTVSLKEGILKTIQWYQNS